MSKRLHELAAASGAIGASDVCILARPSATVTIAAATISAAASDQSYNDSGNGFLTAGFAAGDSVLVQGFGTGANNIFTGRIDTAAAGKLVIIADGSPIVDEAAGASVVITKWETRREFLSELLQRDLSFAASDESTALTTGTGKVTLRATRAMTLTEVRASLTVAQTSGSLLTVDVKVNGTTIFSTLLTFDNTEKTTVTATTPAVLSTFAIADNDEITVDVTQVGDGTAAGLKLSLIGY